MNHWMNEGKEILNQGRSKKQVEGNYKVTAIAVIGMFLTILYLVIFNQKKQIKAFYYTHQQFNTYIQL